MEDQQTFKSYTLLQFQSFIQSISINRKITHIQIHHTWKPRKIDYRGEATIVGMWRYHTQTRGWHDIGQHFSVAPDGLIWDGRSLESDPAGISGHNKGGVMFEIIGNFDKGEEQLEGKQLEAIIGAVRLIISKFNLKLDNIIFHREYSSKTCPGTGITKDWFLEQVKAGRASLPDSQGFIDSPKWKKDYIDWFYQEGLLSSEEWKKDIEASLPLWAEALVIKRFYRKYLQSSNELITRK
ncbi:peptidoglycan recognition protein family protein [Calidifontibacillus oryziterrae]|uniref:peptidoglycan recognition protein family protein n=1 Tax=Calidifontibacillus oryziterrae TaxID=1191699 RepID=UPI0002E1C5DE|nr:peptidoglycan recognition family protein [Calidifontibacillus oryziterrae]